jgi:predicted dehydrogenase
MHRGAAEMDGWWQAVAACVLQRTRRALAPQARRWGSIPARSYGSVDEMLERERQRADGIEAVAIMTPERHALPFSVAALDAGLDVVGDKPVTQDFAEGARPRRANAPRQAACSRSRTRIGVPDDALRASARARCALGAIRLVQVEYIQGGLATRVEDGPQKQSLALDPRSAAKRQALVMSADRMSRAALCVLSSRGARSPAWCADMGALMPGRKVVDYASALIEFDGGARGTFTATQAAAGGENDIRCASTARRECSIGRIAKRAI